MTENSILNKIQGNTPKLREALKNSINELLDGDKAISFSYLNINDEHINGTYNVEVKLDYINANLNTESIYDFGYDLYINIYDSNHKLVLTKKLEDMIVHRMFHAQRVEIIYMAIVNYLCQMNQNTLYDLFKNESILLLDYKDVQFFQK